MGEDGSELTDLLSRSVDSASAGESTKLFADSLGLSRGVTGYTYHTVPVAIHAWLSHPQDYRQTVTTIIQCGGDTNTTAAIVGGIVGAGIRGTGIPSEWVDGIWEYPRSTHWMRSLGESLAVVDLVKDPDSEGSLTRSTTKAPSINPIAVLFRNALFLFIVLFHGFRRIAPPY